MTAKMVPLAATRTAPSPHDRACLGLAFPSSCSSSGLPLARAKTPVIDFQGPHHQLARGQMRLRFPNPLPLQHPIMITRICLSLTTLSLALWTLPAHAQASAPQAPTPEQTRAIQSQVIETLYMLTDYLPQQCGSSDYVKTAAKFKRNHTEILGLVKHDSRLPGIMEQVRARDVAHPRTEADNKKRCDGANSLLGLLDSSMGAQDMAHMLQAMRTHVAAASSSTGQAAPPPATDVATPQAPASAASSN